MDTLTSTTPAPAVQRRAPPPALVGSLRVTGQLQTDAALAPGASLEHRVLLLNIKPAVGLPYQARVDLGDNLADHMAAEALLPALRAGAAVSVAGTHLDLRHDHGHAVLVVRGARHVLVLQ